MPVTRRASSGTSAARKPIKKLTADFTGVSDRKGGGKSAHVPEGDYVLEIVDADVRKKANADSRYVNWQLKIVKPEKVPGDDGSVLTKGKTVYHITTLKPEQLWSLRNFLSDITGKEIPKKALEIDLTKYIGKQVGATLADDEPYTDDDGKTRIKSKIDSTFPATDYSEEEGEEAEEDEEEVEDDLTSSDDDEDTDELETVDDDDI